MIKRYEGTLSMLLLNQHNELNNDNIVFNQ